MIFIRTERSMLVLGVISSVQDGICALRKAHMRSTPSFRSFPNVAFETVPMFVLIFIRTEHNRLVLGVTSSVQDGICAPGKAHMCSTPSFRSFPNVAFEMVPMFVWQMMALSRPFKENRLALPPSMPLSSRILMVIPFIKLQNDT